MDRGSEGETAATTRTLGGVTGVSSGWSADSRSAGITSQVLVPNDGTCLLFRQMCLKWFSERVSRVQGRANSVQRRVWLKIGRASQKRSCVGKISHANQE